MFISFKTTRSVSKLSENLDPGVVDFLFRDFQLQPYTDLAWIDAPTHSFANGSAENVDDVVNENNELRMLRTYTFFFVGFQRVSLRWVFAVDRKSILCIMVAKRDGITTFRRDDLECVWFTNTKDKKNVDIHTDHWWV